jgi:hypothetical protein
LWGFVSYIAGRRKDCRDGALKFDEKNEEDRTVLQLIDIYQRGLASGTDPDGPEYWGHPGRRDQCFVEMAAIGYALLAAPELFWDPLSDEARKNISAWLYTINQFELPPTNWYFFQVFANAGLRNVGAEYDAEGMERALVCVESYYMDEGWYSDGIGGNMDYYNVWAFHDMGLLYAALCGRTDPARARRFRKRAELFGKQYARFFDCEGPAAGFGRSLTYRFAQAAFWSACAVAGVHPLPAGQMKGIIERNISWWLEHPILDRDGVLTIGYGYPQMEMTEIYNGPGSPYWAMKAFYLLALPEQDDFFDTESETLRWKEGVTALKTPNLAVQRYADGHVSLYPAGVTAYQEHGQGRRKYGKLVYDTRFAFSVARGNDAADLAAADSTLCFEIGGYFYERGPVKEGSVKEVGGRISTVSIWEPCKGIVVQTEIIPCEGGHIRHHMIKSEIDCTAYDNGWAVPVHVKDYTCTLEGSFASAGAGKYVCSVSGRYISPSEAEPEGIITGAAPNTSLLYRNTAIPGVRYRICRGITEIETTVKN